MIIVAVLLIINSNNNLFVILINSFYIFINCTKLCIQLTALIYIYVHCILK